MNPFLFTFLGAVAFYYFQKARTANQLQFFPQKANIEGGKFYFYLEVLNPTMTPLTVNNIFLSFYYTTAAGQTFLGRTQITQPVTITKNGSTVLRLPITVAPGALITAIAAALQGKLSSMKISGTVTAEAVQMQVDETIPVFQ